MGWTFPITLTLPPAAAVPTFAGHILILSPKSLANCSDIMSPYRFPLSIIALVSSGLCLNFTLTYPMDGVRPVLVGFASSCSTL